MITSQSCIIFYLRFVHNFGGLIVSPLSEINDINLIDDDQGRKIPKYGSNNRHNTLDESTLSLHLHYIQA